MLASMGTEMADAVSTDLAAGAPWAPKGPIFASIVSYEKKPDVVVDIESAKADSD